MIVSDERVERFIAERLGTALCPPYTVAGLERDGEIVAAVLFNQFEGPNVHVSIAGTGWTRGFIKAVGEYVYGQLGCLRVTVTTEQEKVADYALRLGGQVEGRMRDYFGLGRDAWIIGILRSEWRFGSLPASEQG
ncbi:MAG: hypothetical protein JKY36_07255 [Erythrobacter sp.]|nr:hypothetical protein [Erythrobacter sp.]